MRRALRAAVLGPRRAPGTTDPFALAGLVLKVDPALGRVAGTGVASITDQVSGVVYAQATGSAQPTYSAADATLNNQPALVFAAASSQCLTNAATAAALFPSAATLIVVASLNAESIFSIYDTTPGNNSLWRFSDGRGYVGTFRSVRVETYPNIGAGYDPPSTAAHCYAIRSDATRYRMQWDAALPPEQAGAYSAGTTHAIGCLSGLGSSFFNGSVGLVLGYARYLSDGEIASIRAACVTRFGTA